MPTEGSDPLSRLGPILHTIPASTDPPSPLGRLMHDVAPVPEELERPFLVRVRVRGPSFLIRQSAKIAEAEDAAARLGDAVDFEMASYFVCTAQWPRSFGTRSSEIERHLSVLLAFARLAHDRYLERLIVRARPELRLLCQASERLRSGRATAFRRGNRGVIVAMEGDLDRAAEICAAFASNPALRERIARIFPPSPVRERLAKQFQHIEHVSTLGPAGAPALMPEEGEA